MRTRGSYRSIPVIISSPIDSAVSSVNGANTYRFNDNPNSGLNNFSPGTVLKIFVMLFLTAPSSKLAARSVACFD